MKKLLCLLALALLLPVWAAADTAAEVTSGCAMTMGTQTVPAKKLAKMQDDDYNTYYTLKPGKTLTVQAEQELGGVWLQLFDVVRKLTMEALVGEEWVTVSENPAHLTDWYALPEGATAFRIKNNDSWNLWIGEMAVYAPGDKPAEVHQWQELTRSDLMLIVAHPDDDLLWFAGLLPTYAGERQLQVQVAYLVPTTGNRKLELLDALWLCGVRAYPAFLDFRDVRGGTMEKQYDRWGGQNKVVGRVVQAIRRYRPSVIVTQGEKGEYGHPAHKVVCDAVKRAITQTGNADKFPKSSEMYGTWEVQKVYLHEYTKNQLHMDWHVPLSAFGGEDAYSVACRAMACHASQVKHGWALEDPGEHDNTLFGLYYTAVGADEACDDLMEHVVPVGEAS